MSRIAHAYSVFFRLYYYMKETARRKWTANCTRFGLQNLLTFLTIYLRSFTIGRQQWVLVIGPSLPKGESLRWTHWKNRWTHTFFQSLHTISRPTMAFPEFNTALSCCLAYFGNPPVHRPYLPLLTLRKDRHDKSCQAHNPPPGSLSDCLLGKIGHKGRWAWGLVVMGSN